MRTKQQRIPLLSVLSILLVACEGGGLPLPPARIDISIRLTADELPPGVALSEAYMSLAQLELLSDIDTSGQDLPVNRILSLNGPQESVSLFDAPPALYSRVKLRLDKQSPNEALPADFQGEALSFLLLGQATIADGSTVPMRIQDKKPYPRLDALIPVGLDLLPGATGELQLTQDLSQIFTDADFSLIALEDLTDGELLLDLSDVPFLNEHPALEVLGEQLTSGLERSFGASEEDED